MWLGSKRKVRQESQDCEARWYKSRRGKSAFERARGECAELLTAAAPNFRIAIWEVERDLSPRAGDHVPYSSEITSENWRRMRG